MHPGKRKVLDSNLELRKLLYKVERPLRVIKKQFGCAKVRYLGLGKSLARLMMQFALDTFEWPASGSWRWRDEWAQEG